MMTDLKIISRKIFSPLNILVMGSYPMLSEDLIFSLIYILFLIVG